MIVHLYYSDMYNVILEFTSAIYQTVEKTVNL